MFEIYVEGTRDKRIALDTWSARDIVDEMLETGAEEVVVYNLDTDRETRWS